MRASTQRVEVWAAMFVVSWGRSDGNASLPGLFAGKARNASSSGNIIAIMVGGMERSESRRYASYPPHRCHTKERADSARGVSRVLRTRRPPLRYGNEEVRAVRAQIRRRQSRGAM